MRASTDAWSATSDDEQWPRWLPTPYLRDQRTHFVTQRGERGACGVETMWAKPGHPTTLRPRCRKCVSLVQRGNL